MSDKFNAIGNYTNLKLHPLNCRLLIHNSDRLGYMYCNTKASRIYILNLSIPYCIILTQNFLFSEIANSYKHLRPLITIQYCQDISDSTYYRTHIICTFFPEFNVLLDTEKKIKNYFNLGLYVCL
jgi:hypothetical protein